MSYLWKLNLCGFALVYGLFSSVPMHAQPAARDFSVELTASVSEFPVQITLSWRPDANASAYSLSRRTSADGGWTHIATLDGSATVFVDSNVQSGGWYEYQAIKSTGVGYTGYGYIRAGIRRDPIEFRGKVIVLVESTLAVPLQFELSRYQQDLVGDGWTVLRHDVSANDSVPLVKDIIRSDYLSDPANVKSLFLFGHVPVPYSGDIAPDGHPNHQGAWPADVYYGVFEGSWTDSLVNSTGAENVLNHNIPGDGKFDQSLPPGPVQLEIGRVDFSNMTCFENKLPPRNEVDLARQYLNKDYSFRHLRFNFPRRGLIFDHRGTSEEDPMAGTAWRSFPGFFGPDQIRQIGVDQYLPVLETDGYLWSDVCSSGSLVTSDYAASSDDFAQNDPHVVFTSFLGSYFADWNRESNLLRAVLGASSFTLTSIFGGQPQWLLHPMALGETIGYSARLTQNNSPNGIYPPHKNFGVGQIHIALMGDPTLRLHPVAPPANVRAEAADSGLRLVWDPSVDSEVIGYRVYRSTTPSGPFVSVNGDLRTTSVMDPSGSMSSYYMVRALKLERSGSGTYFNLSQGAFFPDPSAASQAPAQPNHLTVINVSTSGVALGWLRSSVPVTGVRVQRKPLSGGDYITISTLRSDPGQFSDTTVNSGSYSYRLQAFNSFGNSDFSSEAIAEFRSGQATYVGLDSTTQGDWIGRYGQEGYIIVGAATNIPPNVEIATDNLFERVYSQHSNDPKALLRPDRSDGILSSWFGPYAQPYSFTASFSDKAVHRLAIYFLDQPDDSVNGYIELSDSITGQLLVSKRLSNNAQGGYLVFDVSGNVRVRIVSIPWTDATVPGCFFSTAVLDTPVITPAGGNFPGKSIVSITSGLGATIHYTINGASPDENSPVYQAPFEVRSNVAIKAKAYKAGYAEPSNEAEASFTNAFGSDLAFIRTDTSTHGDWPGQYGQGAYWVMQGGSKGADFVDFGPGPHDSYTWSDNSSEARAIRRSSEDSVRIGACWSSPDQLDFDVAIYDVDPHPVALYFMDWDRNGRIEDVVISNPEGIVLDTRRVGEFADGNYLVWNAKGIFHISVIRVQGNNSILNGIFIGPAVIPVSSALPPKLVNVSVTASGYRMQVNAERGQTLVIEMSENLTDWGIRATQTLASTTWDFTDTVSNLQGTRMYRARLVR